MCMHVNTLYLILPKYNSENGFKALPVVVEEAAAAVALLAAAALTSTMLPTGVSAELAFPLDPPSSQGTYVPINNCTLLLCP